jgi:hypothetical protein
MNIIMHVKELHNNIVQQLSTLSFKSQWNGIPAQELTRLMHVLNDSTNDSL